MTEGSISIPVGSNINDIIGAFESIGFTNQTTSPTTTADLYWDSDTEHKFFLTINVPASGNTSFYLNDSNVSTFKVFLNMGHNSGVMSVTNSLTTNAGILDYVIFDNNILFGVRRADLVKRLMGGYIMPKETTDPYYLVHASQFGDMYNPTWRATGNPTVRNPLSITTGVGNLTNTDISSIIEVIKLYDNVGFINNIYGVVIHPTSVPGQCYTATIGDKTFLVYNWSTSSSNYQYTHIAFDITETTPST